MDGTTIYDYSEKFAEKNLKCMYSILLVVTIIILAGSIILSNFEDTALSIPVVFILMSELFMVKGRVTIPPVMIFMLVAIMALILIGRRFEDSGIISIPINILFGLILGLTGLIVTYSLLRTMPGLRDENPRMTAFVSISIGVSLYMMINLIAYYLNIIFENSPRPLNGIMDEFTMALLGMIIVALVFYLNRHNGLFRYTVNKYLESNAGTIGIEEHEIEEIKKTIRMGETDKSEYKSTLRTNLATGEKDPKMEKAVLKTLVAFMNTNGGTLLIGVSDDGSVVGIDESSFDNRDKLNLHMTHLIANQIGNDFLHFVSFRLSDYEGKGVMRVICKKSDSPVFLIEGKTETFFVRSGPSSIELHGTDMLNYAATRFKLNKRKKRKEV